MFVQPVARNITSVKLPLLLDELRLLCNLHHLDCVTGNNESEVEIQGYSVLRSDCNRNRGYIVLLSTSILVLCLCKGPNYIMRLNLFSVGYGSIKMTLGVL